MAGTNPCGISFKDTVDAIKNNVLKGGYNGRNEVMTGLMKDGFSYSEAKQITDYYYDIYRRVAAKQKISTPGIALTAEQKKNKILNNMAVSYLRGETGGIPMMDNDISHLESIYEKADKADTPTLKAKYDEEAAIFVSKFLPEYANELFKTSVYARPLLSSVFFIKSVLSNFHARVERSISNAWDGKNFDFKWLTKFDGLANESFYNTLKGGVPATTVAQDEKFGLNKGRLEESGIEGTDANSSKPKAAYYNTMKFYSKWSNRLNSAPDTAGIYSNAERHMYQLLKEKYREEGNDNKRATKLALQDMDLDDEHTSTVMAEKKFAELGEPIRHSNGKLTSEFKVAVEEYRRRHRDNVIWQKALDLSKNDFWKKNMTVASELGFGDYGMFGIMAQRMAAWRNSLEKGAFKNKGKLGAAVNLYTFGFLNGAANFAEDGLERFPLYGAVKIAFLQANKKSVSDYELRNDIARRQKDIIVKTATTALFFATMKALESLLCPGSKDRQSSSEISSGRVQVGPCGIPLAVPPQMLPMYKSYRIISNAFNNDEDALDAALNVLPVLVQSNDMGLQGVMSKMAVGAADYEAAMKTGNDVRAAEAAEKMKKAMVRSAADVANSFLPIPSRAIAEGAVVTQKSRGITQQEQQLMFRVDENGKVLPGALKNLGKMTVGALGNVTGISEVMIAAQGAGKSYAMDWQGRKVAQFRLSDIFGSGVQYNDNDAILIEAGVRAPYINRLEKIEYENDSSPSHGFLKGKVDVVDKKVRYMTDEEFFNVSEALGKFNAEYFEKHHDKIREVLQTNEPIAKKDIQTLFARSHNAAIKAITAGKSGSEEIYKFILHNWDSDRARKLTNTDY